MKKNKTKTQHNMISGNSPFGTPALMKNAEIGMVKVFT
jgi:hypothetical protein